MRTMHRNSSLSVAALAVASLQASAAESPSQRSLPAAPPTECQAYVGYDRDRTMTGYLLPTKAGAKTCVPFSTVGARPPAGYKGDFYVDEFTDAKLRERWTACKRDKECYERVHAQITARRPPNKEHGVTEPKHIHLLGKVAGIGDDVDLRVLRRPTFFGVAPYHEPIAQLESRTHTVEFTAPRDTHEIIHKQMTGTVKLRGWYIRGDGVDDGKGGRQRALIIMTGGGGTRVAAITHPVDRLYRTEHDGRTRINSFPNATSGATGQQMWRSLAAVLNDAGYDVLLHDRRGVGMSTGYSDTNTLQQGRDLLAIVAALRSGTGIRSLTPDGKEHRGLAAAQALRGGPTGTGLPVLFLGSSRGTMASGWAMTMNFDKDCTYDMPEIKCSGPVRDASIKGAIMIAEFTSGPGYVMRDPSEEDEGRGLGRDRPAFIGGNAMELNVVFFPSSAILAGMHKWPAVFFARGLWDYAASLEGTVDSYSRARHPKEIVVVRAPHPYEVWPESEQRRAQERMLAFGRAVLQGKSRVEGGREWTNMKELVATSSDVWEPSTRPTTTTE